MERPIPYVRDTFFAGRDFPSLQAMREAAAIWCREVAARRECRPLGGARPLDVFFAREAPALLRLPPQACELATWSRPKVHADCHPLVVGGQVTYTAAASPVPDGGTVAFEDAGAAISGCGSQPVDTTTGNASCQVSYTATGSHAITAVYSGDAAFISSTSAAVTQQVGYAVTLLYDPTRRTTAAPRSRSRYSS